MNKAVLLNSGGIDSRVTAAILHDQGWEIHSLYNDWTLNVGDSQRKAAEATANAYCVSHEVLPWPNPDWVIWVDNLRKYALPHAQFHSALLGSIYAAAKGIEWIATGARDDAALGSWRNSFQELMNASKYFPDKVLITPLWEMTTREVTERGRALNVDLDSTWSCPNSSPQCGTCASCRRRLAEGISL